MNDTMPAFVLNITGGYCDEHQATHWASKECASLDEVSTALCELPEEMRDIWTLICVVRGEDQAGFMEGVGG